MTEKQISLEQKLEWLLRNAKASYREEMGTDEYGSLSFEAFAAQFLAESGVVLPPIKMGETVFHITKCDGFPSELDGTLYDSNGGPGTATGYYCSCELKDKCPFSEDDFDQECDDPCKKLGEKYAVFEDTVVGIFLDDRRESEELLLEYSGCVPFSEFGKTLFDVKCEAEESLKKMEEQL